MTVRKIKTDDTVRVETGSLQINEDWEGLFIRGDQCIELMFILRHIINGKQLDAFEKIILETYHDIIKNDVLSQGRK